MSDLPLPPHELRLLVGLTEDMHFDNPSRQPLFDLPPEAFDFVLDWGCGCGRLARRLMLQQPPPRRYLGVDLHRGMVRWCQQELAPRAAGFEFVHHDVRSPGLNPQGAADMLPLPAADRAVSFFVAVSVFTHVTEGAALFYLRELARVLGSSGVAMTTWFLFDKADFPMMQESQNALFINDVDPTNAVIYDRGWLRRKLRENGLVVYRVVQPDVRGFQWRLWLARAGAAEEVELPADSAMPGTRRAPLMPPGAPTLGLEPRSKDGG